MPGRSDPASPTSRDSIELFSARARDYAQFRPVYPEALFDWLAQHCKATEAALDIGAGSGQACLPLQRHFRRVLACDASAQQLTAAAPWQSVERFVADAEQLPIRDARLDLIVVAQALHWFAAPSFFAQARRALKPGGLFCAWCYSLLQIDPALDDIVHKLHGETLAGYWPAGRASVDAGYRDIHPPFARLPVPPFAIEANWRFDQLIGYLRTWSAVTKWQQTHGLDPIATIEQPLREAWGDEQTLRPIRWPLHFLAGYPVQ
ncbi:class I SAM-dependent methyltransferase [Stutzerimonas stutzeri]|uniref:class I SAM-dependent methyltransferase n=1 Tax=Stutzerimonas sp. S1 TaxID=3030652 RepID=UPI0022252731|nr:class I SAM-dependent methyltransferase [Stutzerimonas sp. S1]MCW3150710.1 class I SAM-dependent methyltransferase [Stutzerimonas sp. S1]